MQRMCICSLMHCFEAEIAHASISVEYSSMAFIGEKKINRIIYTQANIYGSFNSYYL